MANLMSRTIKSSLYLAGKYDALNNLTNEGKPLGGDYLPRNSLWVVSVPVESCSLPDLEGERLKAMDLLYINGAGIFSILPLGDIAQAISSGAEINNRVNELENAVGLITQILNTAIPII